VNRVDPPRGGHGGANVLRLITRPREISEAASFHAGRADAPAQAGRRRQFGGTAAVAAAVGAGEFAQVARWVQIGTGAAVGAAGASAYPSVARCRHFADAVSCRGIASLAGT
jgi:hypothetical protein